MLFFSPCLLHAATLLPQTHQWEWMWRVGLRRLLFNRWLHCAAAAFGFCAPLRWEWFAPSSFFCKLTFDLKSNWVRASTRVGLVKTQQTRSISCDSGLWWNVNGGWRWSAEKHHRSNSRECGRRLLTMRVDFHQFLSLKWIVVCMLLPAWFPFWTASLAGELCVLLWCIWSCGRQLKPKNRDSPQSSLRVPGRCTHIHAAGCPLIVCQNWKKKRKKIMLSED